MTQTNPQLFYLLISAFTGTALLGYGLYLTSERFRRLARWYWRGTSEGWFGKASYGTLVLSMAGLLVVTGLYYR